MSPRARIAAIAVPAALAGAGALWWLQGRPPEPPAWQGYAEADYVDVAPTQQGLLVGVAVARGDLVQPGAPLFAQDDVADRAGLEQAQRQLGQAQAQLQNLEAAGRRTEIRQAEANLDDARATLVRAQADYRRGEAMLADGGVSVQNVDLLRADYLSAAARVEALQAALAQQRAPLGREREIGAQQAMVAAATAAVALAQWRLAQRTVAAPVGGRVADVMARPGETLAAGAPVVKLLPPQNILVRFFVPETALASVHRGERVQLACDACPADLTATVSFVAPQAEYTPPVIYSEASRAKLVYLVEARPPPQQAPLLNPGEPVAVRPPGAAR